METVAFYSYKGGVGRTLLVANTAQFLAMSGRRVVALDLDLEAPGLHHKLASWEVLDRAESGTLRGVVDELLNSLRNQPDDHTLRQIAINVDLPSGTKGSLLLIPAGSAPSHAYWAALEKLNVSLRERRNGGLAEALLEVQARIADEFAPDFLLVDARTGITELGGLATSVMADRVVCLTTTAPESVGGTRVVAEALRAAPRLSSQKPLRVEFLITRVAAGSTHSDSVSKIVQQLGGDASVLPHDSEIANEERVLSGWRSGQSADSDNEDGATQLFAATLSWIAGSFPGHKEDADKARRRMEAVYRTWRDLTRSRGRNAWPVDQLRERVRVEYGKKSRQADIVVYDGPADATGAKPLMIIEYVDGEDRDVVAKWWLSETGVAVVAVLSENPDRRLYSRRLSLDSRARHSDRWDLPLPHDFKALSDPTDISVDAMLDAVRRGYPEYLEQIITKWVSCSGASLLHAGTSWKPKAAKRIIDGLARVDHVDLAREVLWTASRDSLHREWALGDGDEGLDEQVVAEFFVPLLWRLPPEASIELMHGYRGQSLYGPPAGLVAVAQLARDMLGLRYDPDASFRVEGQRILDRAGPDSGTDRHSGLYALTSAFKHTEITFEISSELSPRASVATEGVTSIVSASIGTRSLVTTGLLGDYQPDLGRVILYSASISECAEKLALRARHVGSVTLIHETLHALMHLGRDLDGRMWTEFALPAANSPLFEPSWFHETLAQYFTYQHIVRLRDPALLHAFEVISEKQAPAYRTWRKIQHLPIEDARSWLMSVRRGTGSASPIAHMLSTSLE